MSEQQLSIMIQTLDKLSVKDEELENIIDTEDEKLALPKEQSEYLTQQLYGAKKESLDINPNQSNLFDDSYFSEPEQTGEQSDEEVIIEKHSRRKKRKGLKEHQLKNLPTVDHIHEVDSCTCPNCQK